MKHLFLISAFLLVAYITSGQCDDLAPAYNASFANFSDTTDWKIIDNNSDGNTWKIYASFNDTTLRYFPSSVINANDWAFTHCLDLRSVSEYNLSFDCKSSQSNRTEKLMVMLASDKDTNSVVDTLYDFNAINWTILQTFDTVFKVINDGNYHIVFKAYSDVDQSILDVDNIVLEKVIVPDMEVISISSSATACELSANSVINIEVKNNGAGTISAFNAKYNINGGGWVSESFSNTLLSQETKSLSFSTTADLSADGTYLLSGLVEMSGDIVPGNDTLLNGFSTENLGNTSNGQSTSDPAGLTIPDDDPTGLSSYMTFCGLANLDSCFKLSTLTIDSLIHTSLSDLDIFLISPSGDTLELSTDNGPGGNDMIDVVFSDTASINISNTTQGIPSGTYHSEDSLGFNMFTGNDPNGSWELFIADDSNAVEGQLYKWSMVFEMCVPTSTMKYGSSAVNIFPNPGDGQFVISLENIENAIIDVFDFQGHLIMTMKGKEGINLLDLNDKAKGFYLVKLNSKKTNMTKRIIIK